MTYYYQFTNATTAAVNQIEKHKELKKSETPWDKSENIRNIFWEFRADSRRMIPGTAGEEKQ